MTALTVPAVPPPFVVRWSGALARALRALALKLAPPQFGLMDLVGSRWISDALGALARLGVPEALAAGPRTAVELGRELSVDPAALHRLLRALASEGLLSESGEGRFGLTPLTAPLRGDHAASVRNVVLNATAEHNARTWAALHRSVQGGRRVWDELHGVDMWTWLSANPDGATWFHGAMAEMTRDVAPAVARAYPFHRHRIVADLAGGSGTLLATVLAAHAALRGILVDQAEVVAAAPAVFAHWGVGDRVEVRSGDVFVEAPAGADALIAKHLLHGYDDERCAQVLRTWRRALPPDGRLLLVEVVVPGPGQPFLAMLDLQMLVTSFGGRERTRAQWEALLRAGGFALVAVHETASPFAVIEARLG